MSTERESARPFDELLLAARSRGFQTVPAFLIGIAALIPTVLLVAFRDPGYSSALLIAAAFVLVPAGAFLLWTLIDSEGRSGRQVAMWLAAIARLPQDASRQAAQGAFQPALKVWEAGGSLEETARAATRALMPMTRNQRSASARMLAYTAWYPIFWTLISAALATIFFAAIWVSPECASLGDPPAFSLCH